MKPFIKQYFPLILTVLGACFAIQIFFHGLGRLPSNIFTYMGASFSDFNQKDNLSTVAQKMEARPNVPLPSIIYSGKTLTIGKAIYFPDLFPLSETNAALYLDDIRNQNGISVLTSLSSSEIETLEELPSGVIYDKEQQLLYFYDSGIYQVSLRLFLEGNDGILLECNIPVEVN